MTSTTFAASVRVGRSGFGVRVLDGGQGPTEMGDPTGRLSVLVPVYNEERTVAEILDRVLALGPVVKEVVVVDDGSKDRTAEIVRAKAEILTRGKDCDDEEVEGLFRSAVEIATKQNALLPALRAATGCARFLTDRRQGSQARAVLAPYAQLIGGLAGSPDAAAAAELT